LPKHSASNPNKHPAGRVQKAESALKDISKGRKKGKAAEVNSNTISKSKQEQGGIPMYAPQSPANPTWSNQADRIAEKLKNTNNR